MLDWLGQRRARAEAIERLVDVDLDAAVARLGAERGRLRHADATRLTELVRRRLEAREHLAYLSRALAEGAISATAACELLESYDDAGYVSPEQFEMLRRHAFEAHRREILGLLADPKATRFDYFRAIDGYRAAGYLSDAELATLRELLDLKLNPAMAARRLFARARTTVDPALQEERLHRYLVEFEGFPDYPRAASLYLGLKIHELWDELPGVRYAREATRRVLELNNLLQAYLPYTSDLSEDVPIDRIVHGLFGLATEFRPLPDALEPITEEHINRSVVVVERDRGEPSPYRTERNELLSVGSRGRVRAVRGDLVVVDHRNRTLPYTQSWVFDELAGTKYAKVQRNGSLAVWRQAELGLVEHREPSPVFVHQYREAVHDMAELLDGHRTDNSRAAPESIAPPPEI